MAPFASCLLSLLLLLTLGGCTTFHNHKQATEQGTTLQQQSEQMLKKLQQPPQRRHFQLHQEPWISKKAIALQTGRLPNDYNRNITFSTGTPMPLNEFSKLITKLCGLPVQVTPDAAAKIRGKSGENPAIQTEPMIDGIRWQGQLTGLLDMVSASLGLSWKYSSSGITLYYLSSRTFQIYAIPSDTEMKSTVRSGIDISNGSDNKSDGSGQSSQNTSVLLKSTLVRDIHHNIQSMLTPEVGHMSAATSTGSITVIDTPEVLDRIACYLQHENHTITKQVLLNIKLLTVELADSDQMSINWSLIPKQPGIGNALGSLGLIATDYSASDSSTVKIIKGGRVNGGQVSGEKFLLNALAQQGKISVVTSPSVTTLNLQPVPVQIATQLSYVARTEVTKTARTQTIALTPGMLTYGFNMNLLPFVMANNQLLLQYAINLSELIELKTFGKSGDSQIQLPEINTRIFSQKVKLKSGETLVLSGFEQTRNAAQRQGAGAPSNWILGGKIQSQQKRQVIVLMITPVLLS